MANIDEKMKAMLAVQLPVQATTGEAVCRISDQSGHCVCTMTPH